MASVTAKLTVEQFQDQFGRSERAYEFWYGEAIPKSMPTWVHGLLQAIILQLLKEAGFHAASEVELRIDPDAHPRPDVIASKSKPRGAYPTQAADIVVEIVSEDEPFPHLKDKCRKYRAWGFGHVYVVDPSDRTVSEWRGALVETDHLAGIAAGRIWEELDLRYESEASGGGIA
jgi:Uma2 family endonuclease